MVNGFTEEEVKKADEFIKFIGKNFKKEMDTAETFKYVDLFTNMNRVIRKLPDFIADMSKSQIIETEEQESSEG